MLLQTGFRGQVPCPMRLLDLHDAVVVPLAKGRQTNPLYDSPPDSAWAGMQLMDNCSRELKAYEFKIAQRFEAPTRFEPSRQKKPMWFLYAKVDLPGWLRVPAYINVWAGKELDSKGTLYCSLACTPTCAHCCLCGSCRSDWQQRGWICKNLSWHRPHKASPRDSSRQGR